MKLKPRIKKLEDVPENVRALYKPDGDEFVLDIGIEGMVDASKLDEFRTNNIKLKQDMEKLQEQLNGIDLEEYKELKKSSQQMKEKKLLDEGKVEELFVQRTEAMRKDHEKALKAAHDRITALETENKTHLTQLESVLIDSELSKAVNKVGVPLAGAMEDIVARGKRVFKLKDGKPIALADDGTPIYGKDGKTPMSMDEYAQTLVQSAPFLFSPSKGSGGAGPDGKGQQQGGAKVIAKGDQAAFGANLEDIAAGKVVVQ